MLRDIKYLFKIAAGYIFGIPAAGVAFVAAYYYIFGSDPQNGDYISGMLVGIISMMSLAIIMSFYSSFANIALSMGSTRRSLFLTIQIYKITISLAMLAAAFLINESLKFFYKINFFTNANGLIICLGITLILGTIGESIGVTTARWGRVGVVVFMIACGLFGAFIGLSVAMGNEATFAVFNFVNQGAWQGVLVFVIASGIITIGNFIMYKKSLVI